MDTVTLWACIDCRDYAHGITEHERGEAYPAAVTEALPRMVADNGGASVMLTPGTDEHECRDEDGFIQDDCECDYVAFSWNRCELCLSNLGGDRFAVTAWID